MSHGRKLKFRKKKMDEFSKNRVTARDSRENYLDEFFRIFLANFADKAC